MILSVSRRTDIPAFYSDWFLNRIKEGYLCVRNPLPMYHHNVSKISLNKDVIDCIVFWTKNARPMLDKLDQLSDYKYYFQYTINGYGIDIEPVMGKMLDQNIQTFQELSEKIGSDKVIWRYDPIIFTDIYTMEYHINKFKYIAEKLKGKTRKCVISFYDAYEFVNKRLKNIVEPEEEKLREFVKELVKIAKENDMVIETCAEKIDLSEEGVLHGHCIDKAMIESIVGYPLTGGKDQSQRKECGCMTSIDIGTYNTCKNQCKYCYATWNEDVSLYVTKYDVNSEFLCSLPEDLDTVTEKKMKSLRRKENGKKKSK